MPPSIEPAIVRRLDDEVDDGGRGVGMRRDADEHEGAVALERLLAGLVVGLNS